MKKNNIISIAILITACANQSLADSINPMANSKTQEETNIVTLDILPPEPPKTGVERDTPIVLMTCQEFNDRLQQSPLWEYLFDKDINNGSYTYGYYLIKMHSIINSNSHVRVASRFDASWSPHQRISKVSYGVNEPIKRNQYHHQILNQERIEMIETLKLVFTDMSNEKASQTIDTLYQQYKEKVNNKDYLSDNETIHTYVKHDGKIIAFWGKVNCDFDMFDGMTIN